MLPHKSPRRINNDLKQSPQTSTSLVLIFKVAFWIGLLHGTLGSFITFYPGSDCGWFIVSGVLITVGLFVPNARYRVAAFLLCLLCFMYAYSAYVRGIEYHKWLLNR